MWIKCGSTSDFPWSLLITDLAAINDPARVSDPCVDLVTPSISNQEWAFGYLLNHMANTAMTGVSADAFAAVRLFSRVVYG